MTLRLFLYILVMAGVTYLIRVLPFILFRKPITSRYVRRLLYYLPYCVLAAMVIPAVFSSTGDPLSATAGLIVAVILAFFHRSLLTVAVGASAAAYLAGLLLSLL